MHPKPVHFSELQPFHLSQVLEPFTWMGEASWFARTAAEEELDVHISSGAWGVGQTRHAVMIFSKAAPLTALCFLLRSLRRRECVDALLHYTHTFHCHTSCILNIDISWTVINYIFQPNAKNVLNMVSTQTRRRDVAALQHTMRDTLSTHLIWSHLSLPLFNSSCISVEGSMRVAGIWR